VALVNLTGFNSKHNCQNFSSSYLVVYQEKGTGK